MAKKRPVKRAKKQVKGRQKRSIFAYPLVLFLLLCAGIFLIAWTFRAGAADIHVTAKVSAAAVTSPAVITSPTNGAHFTSIPIPVSGTCPANVAYVEIFDNDVMRGTAICDGSGNFNLFIDLFPDANSLVAHVFNSTDDEGPASTAVNVVYDVPQPPAQKTPQNSGGTPANINPLILKTAFIYKGFHVGDLVQWPVDLSGGLGPYAISVDWGDGTSDLFSRSQAGQFQIEHTYTQTGGPENSFTIKVKASDGSGRQAFLQFFVIVTPSNIQQAGIFSKPTPTIGKGLSFLWIAWPLYLIVLLMAVSYKLGEREELLILRRKGQLRR